VKVAQKMDDEIVVWLFDFNEEVSIRRSFFTNLYHDGKRFFKSTFPLILGYAMTNYRSQGATLRGKVLVDVRHAFCPGLMYVMLSRVPSRSNLRIALKLTPKMFTHVSVPGFRFD
jgi:hypothetical protein